jgi:hypothetical protein
VRADEAAARLRRPRFILARRSREAAREAASFVPARGESERTTLALSFQQWVDYFKWNGATYGLGGGVIQTAPGETQEKIETSYEGLIRGAYRTNGIVFACILARMLPGRRC